MCLTNGIARFAYLRQVEENMRAPYQSEYSFENLAAKSNEDIEIRVQDTGLTTLVGKSEWILEYVHKLEKF